MAFIKCLNPRFITNPYTKEKLSVPCGECDACRSSSQSKWVTRLLIEAKNWPYVVFFTLTYSDKFLPRIDLSEYQELGNQINDCYDFCALHDFKVPSVSVRDVQLFIKRLRKQFTKYEKIKEKQILRYFISSEYGPTTFRPHYHGILFFSSETMSSRFRQSISEAWSVYHRDTCSFESIGRTDCQFVVGSAAQYVASYVSFISYLPSILQVKPFRPFSLHSTCPPIGFADFTDEQVQRIFHNSLTRISFTDPRTNRLVTLPLWRTIKDRLFPKIKGFSKLDTHGRVTLYRLAERYLDSQLWPLELILRDLRFRKIWDENDYQLELIESLCGEILCIDDLPYTDFKHADDYFDTECFKRLLRISRRVLTSCSSLGVSLDYYVSRIEKFYINCDYENLIIQLESEAAYCDSPMNYPLQFLPYLIDPLFGFNGRRLPSSVYDIYRDSFGIPIFENYDIRKTDEYKLLYDRCHSHFEDCKKVRYKNEYVDAHPFAKSILSSLNKL